MSFRNDSVLLLVAGLILVNGILAVSLAAGKENVSVWAMTALLIAGFAGTQTILRRAGYEGDRLVLPLAAFLAAISLIMLLRLNPALFMPQAIWILVGLLAFLTVVFSFRRLEVLAEYKYLCGFIGVSLLLATLIFGVDIGGNKNWIILGPLRFQPSEFAKLFIILFFAAYLNERREVLAHGTRHFGPLVLPYPRFIAPLLAVWGLAMAMLVVQRDLGSALLYFGTTVIMVYIASGRLSYVTIGGILFLIGGIVSYKLYPHVQTRIDIWLDPWADPNGRAYQILQSLFALGSGGMLGTGLTYGFPHMVPEVHTDFIFAAVGEELGLAGTAAIIITYMFLVYRAFTVALLSGKSFNMLVASGLSVFLALQVCLIIGGVTKFFPLTGITLPLISYGGSSVVANFILLGMLFAISKVRAADV